MTAGFDEAAIDVGEVIARALELLRAERHALRCTDCRRLLTTVGGYDHARRWSFCEPCATRRDGRRPVGAGPEAA
jgi:hypothetical protein